MAKLIMQQASTCMGINLSLSASLSRNAKLGKRLRIPGRIFHRVDVQGELTSINTVDEATERASDPIARVPEACLVGHVWASCSDTGLLVDSLDLPRIELERLRGFSTKDEHISAVQLDTGNRLWSDEFHVVHFELVPLLAGHRCTIVTVAPIAIVNLWRPSVKLADQQVICDLGFSIVTRHHIDKTFCHHHSCRVDRLSRQRTDIKPIVCEGIITFTSLGCCRPPSKPS